MTEKKHIFDLIIIGGGPAGVTAGVYAARKKLNTLLITKDFGGQSIVSEYIENWIGEIKISGKKLQQKLETHIKHYQSKDFIIKEFQYITNISEIKDNIFTITTNTNTQYYTKSILITTGAKRRKITVPGADKFEHKGLTYCASCDGPLFTDKDVVVIGGGNSGFESASQLAAYAKSVTILQRDEKFNAEETMIDNVLNKKNTKGILNADISGIFGKKFVEGIKYIDLKTQKEHALDVKGVFIEIGAIPATDFISENLVKKDTFGQIKINHKTGQTSKKGIWAAGDCTDSLYKQNSIAMGDATKAIEDLYHYLK